MITLERIQPDTISITLRDQNGVITRTFSLSAFRHIEISNEEYLGTRRIISQLVVTGNIAIRGDLPAPIDINAPEPGPAPGPGFSLPYGDASDGDMLISSTQSLSRSIFCETLTVTSSGVLFLNSFKIFCRTVLINDGIIHANGNRGASAINNAAGLKGLPLPINDVGGGISGSDGRAGSTGPGQSSGHLNYQAQSMGGAGGRSGAGGNGTSGPGGASVSGGAAVYRPLRNLSLHMLAGTSIITGGAGGAGGASGAGDGTNPGGGGGGAGSGGGVGFIWAKKLVNAGLISAVGGDGGDGGVPLIGNCGGGSGAGAGGGGYLYLVYNEIDVGTLMVNGGMGGLGAAGIGTGTAGSNGSNGEAGRIIRYNALTDTWE